MVFQPAFSKAFAASLPEMLARRATPLDGHENFALIWRRALRRCFLIFSPEPSGNRFLNVRERFLFVFPLRHASGQRRTLGHDPAVFGIAQGYMENHEGILAVEAAFHNRACRVVSCSKNIQCRATDGLRFELPTSNL